MLSIKDEIIYLREELHHHNHNYYVLDKSIISDSEFDFKLKRLQHLEELYPEYNDDNSPTKRIGGYINSNFNSVIHEYKMYSLDNVYSKQELYSWFSKHRKILNKNSSYTCELKYDGVSISLVYINGNLKYGLTRGNGEMGDDVTENIRTIKTIPLKLLGSYPNKLIVRGEIIMPLDVFNKINLKRKKEGLSNFSNPRNTVSGSLKLLNTKEVAKRCLYFIPYSCIYNTVENSTQYKILNYLIKLGFKIPDKYSLCYSIDDVFEYINEWDYNRLNLKYLIDGIVIKINNIYDQKILGFNSKFPKWAIAYKFKSNIKETILNDIIYNVGRTGIISPVGIVNPVKISGSTIKKASLYNMSFISKNDIRIGDKLFIKKGGEIIPKIIGVNYEYRKYNYNKIVKKIVEKCPSCNSILYNLDSKRNLFCLNKHSCEPQIINTIIHFISKKGFNIKSLGTGTIKLLYENKILTNVCDLFQLKIENLIKIKGIGQKLATNIVESISISKKIHFNQFIYSLGIPGIGEYLSKILTKNFNDIYELINIINISNVNIPNIGNKTIDNIKKFFNLKYNLNIINNLLEYHGIIIIYNKNNIKSNIFNKCFLFTGKFNTISRNEAKKVIHEYGGIVMNNFSKKVDFLVVGVNPGNKLSKAIEYKTTIIYENDLLKLLK